MGSLFSGGDGSSGGDSGSSGGGSPGSTAGAAGGIFNAVGDIIGGFSRAASLNTKAQIARNNAILARQNAGTASAIGEEQAGRSGLRTRARLGEILAGQAASGVDVNTGSAVDVRASASELGKLDMMTIRSNAARQAYGYEQEATNQELQSKIYRKGAKIAPWEGVFNAAGSLLGASSKLSSQADAWDQTAGSSGGRYSNLTNDAGEAIWD